MVVHIPCSPCIESCFFAESSLHRAFFYDFLFAATVLNGRISTHLDSRYNQVWLACLGVMLALLFVAMLKLWTTTYIITADEVQRFSGILSRQVTILPLMRITNASANQTFLERLLGLATLRIDSAGGDTAEVEFVQILKVEASEAGRIIREFLYYSDAFQVEFPTGPKRMLNLFDLDLELSDRFSQLFLLNKNNERPALGAYKKFQTDPRFRDHVLFYEYFHGDTGAGVGASHQTGWTGIIARLLMQSAF